MHKTARHRAILKLLEARGSCSVAEFVEALKVSDETIRRDIKTLANRELIERVRGGAMLPAFAREPGFRERMTTNAREKRAIAQAAAGLIDNGDSVLLENGSTSLYVARALGGHRDLFVVTNGIDIARALLANGNRVHLAGGEVRSDDGAVLGASAIEFVRRFRVRHAVVTAGSVHVDGGLMNYYYDETEFALAALDQALHIIAVTDHTKFRKQAPVRMCEFERIGTLVTDSEPTEPLTRRLREAEVRLVVAGTETVGGVSAPGSLVTW
ncbi:DeoR/GlpR family DNA-binding transcription regulator [Arhodomonas sp. SL1]|uniref:DeoR/GlpR family DNA-binding transcription regulator n=1 Tax=Arhodomonas sp. SL1 TaxID=3425691 RepID=UPI003F8824BE